MKRQALLAAALLALFFSNSPASGHDEYRAIGTVTYCDGSALNVSMKDERTANFRIDEKTRIYGANDKIAADDLEVGNYAVVDGYGDSYDDLLALEIKIVPPPAN